LPRAGGIDGFARPEFLMAKAEATVAPTAPRLLEEA